jgi:hypothetical protein
MEIKLGDKIEISSLQLTMAFSELVDSVLAEISDGEDINNLAENQNYERFIMEACQRKTVELFEKLIPVKAN